MPNCALLGSHVALEMNPNPYCRKAGVARNAISRTSHVISRMVRTAKVKHKRRKAPSYHRCARVGGRQICSGFQPATSARTWARLDNVAIKLPEKFQLKGSFYEIVSAAAFTLGTTSVGNGT